MRHPEGCRMQGCWVDGDGVAYHPGERYGVYIVAPTWEKALFLIDSDFVDTANGQPCLTEGHWHEIYEEDDNVDV